MFYNKALFLLAANCRASSKRFVESVFWCCSLIKHYIQQKIMALKMKELKTTKALSTQKTVSVFLFFRTLRNSDLSEFT